MLLPVQIEKIIELNNLAKESVKRFDKKRFIYNNIKKLLSGRSFIGIAGLRGAGKTVLLRQLCNELPNSVYISMDTLDISLNIFDIAKELNKNHHVDCILLDEIHNYNNWQMEIKKIYDFLDVKIIFTSSASIDIIRSKYDLSRRVVVVNLPLFSFREYLYFKKNIFIDRMDLDDILENYEILYQKIYAFEPDFNDFCINGALPSLLDSPVPQTIRNIIEKIMNHDLLVFRKLNREDIANISNILRFISRSSVDVCSYSAIARNAGISKYKAREYIGLLEQTFLLKIIMPYGSNVTKEPKILYSLPFRPHFADGAEYEKIIGTVREEFFMHHISNINADVNYLKSMRGEKLPDYIVFYKNKKNIFEIGGHGKAKSQFKGISEHRIFVLSQPGNIEKGIPLIFFGFLW